MCPPCHMGGEAPGMSRSSVSSKLHFPLSHMATVSVVGELGSGSPCVSRFQPDDSSFQDNGLVSKYFNTMLCFPSKNLNFQNKPISGVCTMVIMGLK